MSPGPIPPHILRLLRHPDSCKVLSAVSDDGYPHSIVLGALIVDDSGRIYAGEAFMHRSSAYLERCPKAEILVWMGKEGYSVRAEAVDHVHDGPVLEEMNRLLERKGMHATALWVFEPAQVWDEGASYTSGDRVLR